MKYFKHCILALALLGLTQRGLAETETKISGYTIHHNAMTTDSLTPEVAQLYNIQRSKTRGLLTISVLKDQPEATGMPVRAKVTALAANLSSQLKTITLNEVIEGVAVYYIGTFRISNEETLRFQLEVTPEGTDQPLKASFAQQFFVD